MKNCFMLSTEDELKANRIKAKGTGIKVVSSLPSQKNVVFMNRVPEGLQQNTLEEYLEEGFTLLKDNGFNCFGFSNDFDGYYTKSIGSIFDSVIGYADYSKKDGDFGGMIRFNENLKGSAVIDRPYKPYNTHDHLLAYLENWSFPVNHDRKNISGDDPDGCMSITLGGVNTRHKGTKRGELSLSQMSKKYPLLHKLATLYVNQVVPRSHTYTSITLNKNIVCLPHRDKNNTSSSYAFAIGDYEGGELVVDGEKHNIKYNPIIFNGGRQEHYSLPTTKGNRYSFIVYDLSK